MAKKKVYLESGKRKTSIAKATLKQDGHGNILVDHVPYTVIPEEVYRERIQEVVDLIGQDELKDIDIHVTVSGGGRMSQVNAVRTAIARVVMESKGTSVLRARLQDYDRSLLSGDARHTEPKKYGGRSARARRQKSYR